MQADDVNKPDRTVKINSRAEVFLVRIHIKTKEDS